ncbi:MAG TPA: RNA polymerase sigma factor [Cyclobacteriaceae bacterium]|jgi:RNA polymerase sigma-70 factor (ECF subfamily)|nr:RNA polymerase sigma factor [Cyclobacteriaceae bacterium]
MDQAIELNLVRKSAEGDHQAFRQLVEAHQHLAYSIAFRFTQDENESEDIVQEAFVKLWKNLPKYKVEFRVKTWLSKMVTNLCLDHLKSGRKKNLVSEGRGKGNEPSIDEDKLEHEELKSIVVRLAEQLTEKQKAVFVLRDLEQLTPEEVCQALQMSAGNMKSNLYYARLKIKEGLQKFYSVKKPE